jgi:hypothetical protein
MTGVRDEARLETGPEPQPSASPYVSALAVHVASRRLFAGLWRA